MAKYVQISQTLRHLGQLVLVLRDVTLTPGSGEEVGNRLSKPTLEPVGSDRNGQFSRPALITGFISRWFRAPVFP